MRIVEGIATVEDVDRFVSRLDAIGDEYGCVVTAFDARGVAGRDHLAAAVERANRAFARDDAIAQDREIEIMLYAAGRRQIDRALALGVEEGEHPVAVVIDGSPDERDGSDEASAAQAVRALVNPGDTLGQCRDVERIRAYFGITDAERSATDASLEELVIERVAMLVVEK